MPLGTVDYLNLSALAYLKFNSSSKGEAIGKLIKDGVIPEKDLHEKSELSALRDPFNPLRSWKVIAQSPPRASKVEVVNYRGYKQKEVVTSAIDFSPRLLLNA